MISSRSNFSAIVLSCVVFAYGDFAFSQAAAGRPDPTPTPTPTAAPGSINAPSTQSDLIGSKPGKNTPANAKLIKKSAKPDASLTGTRDSGAATAAGSVSGNLPGAALNPGADDTDEPNLTPPVPYEAPKKFPKVVTKLLVDDLQKGRGRPAKPGSKIKVHYSAWLYDPTQPLGRGPQFESTRGKTPYSFVLQGKDAQHIRGWDEGLVDLKPGGKRRLIIPAELGYGASGAGQIIPPNATLLFEVELLDVE